MKNKASDRTKLCKKRTRIFHIVSIVCWVGVALFALISVFSKVGGSENTGMDILSEAYKTKLISLSITILILILLSILIKEKLRVSIYMLSVIIGTVLYGEVAMYILLAVWALDEYVFFTLYKKYKQLAIINKEIDRR